MKHTLSILAAIAAVLAALIVWTAPLHVSYYSDWNGLLRDIRARPGLEVLDGSRNEDMTLEEMWFTIRSKRATLMMSLSQNGARRASHRLDGIWIRTGGSYRVPGPSPGVISVHPYGAHLRFDGDEWKRRGLPPVQTLGDVLDHFDEIGHSLATHPPTPTPSQPGEYLHLQPFSGTLRGTSNPQPIIGWNRLESLKRFFR